MAIVRYVKMMFVLLVVVLLGMAAMNASPSKRMIHAWAHDAADTSGNNLKILSKNISEDSLYNIMEGYEQALGVQCGHCHIMKDKNGLEDYASDSVPAKITCRQMMLMTDSLNRKNTPSFFYGSTVQKITCITCHKGKPVPDSVIRL